ncbi:Endoribonuclease L-PSP-domain-containing protein [Suillus americanus]|nr:Endoribonuclease L-PSP-domain-containing protein [Suillus americanus]
MPNIIPILAEVIWDTKADVKKAAHNSLTEATALFSNKVIERFIPALIKALINPVEEVLNTIQLLSATTFVSEVDSATKAKTYASANHLDVVNVAWLENYLVNLKTCTSIIVSHNSCQSHTDGVTHPQLSWSVEKGFCEQQTPIGPYSQAIKAGEFVFVSGCIPLIPSTIQIVEGGIKEQTTQALTNLKAVLEASSSSVGKVVKTTVFLKNMEDFATINKIYEEFFSGSELSRPVLKGDGI